MTTIRGATSADEESLWKMLFYASHSDHEADGTIAAVKANPGLAPYVEGWGRPHDFGYLAIGEDEGAVGGVWARIFSDERRGYGWVDDATPELAIAIAPGGRGAGIGGRLLERLIEEARGRFGALSLSVRTDNPALRLYERFGFREVARVTNRVGGVSLTMVLRFGATAGNPSGR